MHYFREYKDLRNLNQDNVYYCSHNKVPSHLYSGISKKAQLKEQTKENTKRCDQQLQSFEFQKWYLETLGQKQDRIKPHLTKVSRSKILFSLLPTSTLLVHLGRFYESFLAIFCAAFQKNQKNFQALKNGDRSNKKLLLKSRIQIQAQKTVTPHENEWQKTYSKQPRSQSLFVSFFESSKLFQKDPSYAFKPL